MAFLFGKKGKSPADLVKSTKEAFSTLEKGSNRGVPKAVTSLSGFLADMKLILYGDFQNEPVPEQSQELAAQILAAGLIPMFVNNLTELEFEAKKDVASIVNNLLRRPGNPASKDIKGCVELFAENSDLLQTLVEGYQNSDIALNCGSMLRECIRHENLAKIILYSNYFTKFFAFVELSNFDVASDAFATFKELLTKHKQLCAAFLEKNYDEVFTAYTQLLHSANYVTRRQSLKLLGELLLDRANFSIMTKYISDQNNLKIMMNLLRDKSRNIQFEAFHVFKVFVANPNKPQPILEILQKNKEKLITFLNNFHNDNEEDQFNDEKSFLLKQVRALPSA
eukprot:CAMPEP_0177655236 /NCGR_PEP_ID=MMETSP0447-20121125/14837_1 /TAXON_ID=0 /ORGANISM="Stygamoeba regulata, Strain BSH-02190019" /LENGTH=337 /DNA_ID=CAMNT_0019159097 /DNA_START=17 /DNA_END=1030 /DNA_ORIENTATION=+